MIPSRSVSVSPAASHIFVSSGLSRSAASTSDVDLGIEHLLSMTRYQCQNAVFHYGGVCFMRCFIMVGYVSLWWGMFHYGGVCFMQCFIMVGYVSLWWGMFHAVFHYGGVCFMVGYISCGILLW